MGQAIAATTPTQTYTLAPAPGANGQPRGYFTLSAAPGSSTTDVVVIGNPEPVAQRLRVGVTAGMTAANSGSAFSALTARCTGTACWVTGLPQVVTLPPNTKDWVRFQVKVPADVRPAQYLAGIAVTPDVLPRPVRVGSEGHTSSEVLLVSRVVIGVAVTVGKLAALQIRTEITGVTGGWLNGVIRLNVGVRNVGQRFTYGNGTIACSLGSAKYSYRLSMDTVLPEEGAGLAVNGLGMRAGTWRCTARIKDSGGNVPVWTGLVTVASTTPATRQIAPGVFVAPPSEGIPLWAILLMVLGGLILVSLWAAILLRRQRNSNVSGPPDG